MCACADETKTSADLPLIPFSITLEQARQQWEIANQKANANERKVAPRKKLPPFPLANADELQIFRTMIVDAAIFRNTKIREVRVAFAQDGTPLFVLSDLAQMVGMSRTAGGSYLREKMTEQQQKKGRPHDLFYSMQAFTGSFAAHRPLIVCSVYAVVLLIHMEHRSLSRQTACRLLPPYICAWLRTLRSQLKLPEGQPIPPLFHSAKPFSPPTPSLVPLSLQSSSSSASPMEVDN